MADRDLAQCRTPHLNPDWQLNIAYNAALQAATAALAAAGYRAARGAHHYRVIQSLAHTIEADPGLVIQLDKFRKKRNITEYEQAGAVSEQEAKEMFALAKNVRDKVEKWLRSNHPELL
jgi:HEPN domain-containing protein